MRLRATLRACVDQPFSLGVKSRGPIHRGRFIPLSLRRWPDGPRRGGSGNARRGSGWSCWRGRCSATPGGSPGLLDPPRRGEGEEGLTLPLPTPRARAWVRSAHGVGMVGTPLTRSTYVVVFHVPGAGRGVGGRLRGRCRRSDRRPAHSACACISALTQQRADVLPQLPQKRAHVLPAIDVIIGIGNKGV